MNVSDACNKVAEGLGLQVSVWPDKWAFPCYIHAVSLDGHYAKLYIHPKDDVDERIKQFCRNYWNIDGKRWMFDR